jgi:hypothetical protein
MLSYFTWHGSFQEIAEKFLGGLVMGFRVKSFKISIPVMAALALSGYANAGVYTFEIRSMDDDRGIGVCNSEIQEIAARFQQQSGVRLIGAECEADPYLGGLRGKVVYSAPERIMPWSTTSTTYGEERDLFVSREHCESALAREVEVMRTQTGLDPFMAFCHKTSDLGPPRYRTRIDAIGSSEVNRFESAALTHYQVHDVQSVVDFLNRQAVGLGLTPVAWYAGPMNSTRGLAVAHYQRGSNFDRYRLLSKSSLFLPVAEECDVASASFDQTRSSDWVGTTGCTAAHPTVGFQFNLFWWDQKISGDLTIRSTILPGTYPSLGECRAAAAEISRQLSADGEKVVGVICGHEGRLRGPIRADILTLSN